MKNLGDHMFAYGVLYLGLVVAGAALAYLAYDTQSGTVAHLQTRVAELSVTNADYSAKLKKLLAEFDLLKEAQARVAVDAQNLSKEVEGLQEHCAKLRGSQMELQDQLSKKKQLIKMPKGPIGPIQVEVMSKPFTPPKNLGKKKGQ